MAKSKIEGVDWGGGKGLGGGRKRGEMDDRLGVWVGAWGGVEGRGGRWNRPSLGGGLGGGGGGGGGGEMELTEFKVKGFGWGGGGGGLSRELWYVLKCKGERGCMG